MIRHKLMPGEKLYKFTVLLLVYTLADAHCYPWEPFNRTNHPFHDQDYNEEQPHVDYLVPRRPLKREVFIVPLNVLPTFCAAGYTPDLRGRCVPIIRADERAYDLFLIEQMKNILRKEMTFAD